MSDDHDTRELPGTTKIFPRNLTARAARVVLGNPPSARPESGVDNTHPGLEFDQRNLDRFFFPGLTVAFHFLDGARVIEIGQALRDAIQMGDQPVGDDVYLWYVYGHFGAAPEDWQLKETFGRDGYDVLRTVRDLEADKVAVVIGRRPTQPLSADFQNYLILLKSNALQALVEKTAGPLLLPPLKGEPDGRLFLASFVARRAAFLTAGGVIDPTLADAGELTRSLCAPWQWDFADCGCHYWASNKPDLVVDSRNGALLNFQRQRDPAPPAPADPRDVHQWTANQITQPEMLDAWTALSFVVGDQERDSADLRPVPEPRKRLDRQQIIDKLTTLATIEHALAVEYLSAHYSIKAPMDLKDVGADPRDATRFNAAHQLYQIAVDEMRHLRWANEALGLLRAPMSLGRARRLPDGPDGNDGAHQGQVFSLSPLTREHLTFLIEVERPSRHFLTSELVDGMYTEILVSLRPDMFSTDDGGPDPDVALNRMKEVIKLIIEEGHAHYERLMLVREKLEGDDDYLRWTDPPTRSADAVSATLQHLTDDYYAIMLEGLTEVFACEPRLRGEMLRHARRSMHSLHEAAHMLAARGAAPLFTLPEDPLGRMRDRLRRARQRVDETEGTEICVLAGYHMTELRAMADEMEQTAARSGRE